MKGQNARQSVGELVNLKHISIYDHHHKSLGLLRAMLGNSFQWINRLGNVTGIEKITFWVANEDVNFVSLEDMSTDSPFFTNLLSDIAANNISIECVTKTDSPLHK